MLRSPEPRAARRCAELSSRPPSRSAHSPRWVRRKARVHVDHAEVRSASLQGVGILVVLRDHEPELVRRHGAKGACVGDGINSRYPMPGIDIAPNQWLPAHQTTLVSVPAFDAVGVRARPHRRVGWLACDSLSRGGLRRRDGDADRASRGRGRYPARRGRFDSARDFRRRCALASCPSKGRNVGRRAAGSARIVARLDRSLVAAHLSACSNRRAGAAAPARRRIS